MIGISITWTSSIVLGSEVEFESISCKHLLNFKNLYYVINYLFIQITLGINVISTTVKKSFHTLFLRLTFIIEEFEQIQSYMNYYIFHTWKNVREN